jgi:Transposase DDE domain/Transposase domain (DUF772)
MRPTPWHPPVALSAAEEAVIRRVRRAKLFPFLRRIRHELFDAEFQEELASLYADSPFGHEPAPPAKLALVTLLQAYTGVSDDEAIEALVMDRRWQLVLDCLDSEQAPFGKGTLVRFRQALVANNLDRKLIERTVALADRGQGMTPRGLRVALDSSPLWGAGRVEDTYNLIGHALRKALGMIAVQQGWEWTETAHQAGAGLLTGPSLKAALDCDWQEPEARRQALELVRGLLTSMESFWATQSPEPAPPIALARQLWEQDTEEDSAGQPALRDGVAKNRRISVEDGDMRHGRKSRSQRVDGFKRHVLRDLDTGIIRAVGVTAANVAEATVTDALDEDLAAQGLRLADFAELAIDRGYLSSRWVRERPAALDIVCKAWPVRNGDRFAKTAFQLDFDAETVQCPNGVTAPLRLGATVHFPPDHCASCPLRDQCTTSSNGRSVTIHQDERLLAELRARQLTTIGRAKLRERVAVEHSLAHIGHWQGRRARYRGKRKNLFDLRRTAAILNLHIHMNNQADRVRRAA